MLMIMQSMENEFKNNPKHGTTAYIAAVAMRNLVSF